MYGGWNVRDARLTLENCRFIGRGSADLFNFDRFNLLMTRKEISCRMSSIS